MHGKGCEEEKEGEREIGVCVRELKQRFDILFYKKGKRERERGREKERESEREREH